MHAATVEADNAFTCSRQWQGHVDEHERPMGPIDMDARIRPYLLTDTHMDDDAPSGLVAGFAPSGRVHACDDHDAGLPAGFMEYGVMAAFAWRIPADEAQAATP